MSWGDGLMMDHTLSFTKTLVWATLCGTTSRLCNRMLSTIDSTIGRFFAIPNHAHVLACSRLLASCF